MRLAILTLLLAALAGAQDSRPSDPAALLPRGASIYVEAADLAGAARLALAAVERLIPEAPASAPASRARGLGPDAVGAGRARLIEYLQDLEKTKARRVAYTFLPALIGSSRWIWVVESDDPDAFAALAAKWSPEAPMVSRPMPPFTVLADSKATLDSVAAIRDGSEKSLAGRADFKRFRERCGKGVLAAHLDVGKLAPTIARIGLSNKDDVGAVLFTSHLLHAAKTARTLSASVLLDDAASLELFAEVDPILPPKTFTETRPSQPVIVAPPGCVARLSLPRDVAQFWNDREQLLSEKARGSFAEFQTNLGVLMGGLTAEDLFAGLGSAYDFYVVRSDAGAEGRRYPSAALVATLVDPALKTELLTSFQTTIGIVNAQRSQEKQPRLFQESFVHRDVLIACARFLPESLPDPSDDRLQLEPCLAVAGDRVIAGSNRAIVRALLDQLLDGRFQPRVPGDEAETFGTAASEALLDAGALIRSQMTLKEGRSEEAARETVKMIAVALSRVSRAHARVDVEKELATLSLRIEAPALLRAPESR